MTSPRNPFTRGIRGYASIVASLHHRPATAQELIERFKITERQLLTILRQLHALGVVYVRDWRASRSGARNFARVWAFNSTGSRVDAETPVGPTGRPLTRVSAEPARPKLEIVAFHRLIDSLRSPQTPAHLVDDTGISKAAIYKFVNHARTVRLIHIAEWETGMDKPYVPMFTIGRSADAPKPALPSNSEKCAKYMRNRRAREADKRVMFAIARQSL